MRRIRTLLRRIADTIHYARLWRAAPPSARHVPATMLAKAPICWVRGHSWERGPSFGITSWCAQFCTCCGQEVAFRVSLDQLHVPETDEEIDQAAWEREYESRTCYGDDYLDADGSWADWDAMRDAAAANGGPF